MSSSGDDDPFLRPGPSDAGSGISGWDDLALPDWLKDLKSVADVLVEFGKAPLRFIRKRIIPFLLGGIFGLSRTVGESIAAPFEAIAGSLLNLADIGATAVGSALNPILGATVDPVVDILAELSAAAGPLQPFVAGAGMIALGYLAFVILSRISRAGLEAIPLVGPALNTLLGG